MTASFLPYGRQSVDREDIESVLAVLESDLLTTGPAVDAFASALCEQTGAAYAVPCSSGTAALHLAALALQLGRGDSVVVPSLTFVATANAVRYVGAEVVLADVDPDTGLMGPRQLEEAISSCGGGAPSAVFPVHLNGQCQDPAGISETAGRYGLRIVEDAAHAIGTRYGATENFANAVGGCAHADMTIFSFHPVKTAAMGEGGAITTNDPALFGRLEKLVNHGLIRDAAAFENDTLAFDASGAANPWYYELHELGFNYRASDIHCALGRSQLGKLARFVERRCALVEKYETLLAPLAPVVRPVGRVPGCRPAWHLMTVLVDFEGVGIERATVMRRLRERNIGTQVHYLPVHLQPYYQHRYGPISLPGAETYYRRVLTLPLFVEMTHDDVGRVVDALAESLAEN